MRETVLPFRIIVLAITLLMGGQAIMAQNNQEDNSQPLHILMGDVNSDGIQNVTDVMMLVNTILGKVSPSDDEEATERPIILEVSQSAFVNPEQAKAGMRRSPMITAATLGEFSICGRYVSDESMRETFTSQMIAERKAGDTKKWIIKKAGGWPSDAEDDVTFYAFNAEGNVFNKTYNGTTNPHITVNVDEYADKQIDLLVAQATEYYDHYHGQVHLVFDHVCAAAQFAISMSSKLIEKEYSIAVNSVKISGIKSTGNYFFETGNWSNREGNADYTLYELSSNSLSLDGTAQSLAAEGDYLFLIPQALNWDKSSLSSGSNQPDGAFFKINCTISKGNTTVFSGDAYIPFNATLEKGVIHHFNIQLGTGLRKIENQQVVRIFNADGSINN